MNRSLSSQEEHLLTWLLSHGNEKARNCLELVPLVRVFDQCPCGCASVDFTINGKEPNRKASLEVVSDYLWTSSAGAENGVFVFLKDEQLAGLEVWSVDGIETPSLPEISSIQLFRTHE